MEQNDVLSDSLLFTKNARFFGLLENCGGKQFTMRGLVYEMVGFSRKNHDCPIVVKRVRDGRLFNISIEDARRGLGTCGEDERTKIEIRFSHNGGMLVEARFDGGPWEIVELRSHGEHVSRAYGWGEPTTVMSTARDERAYLDVLDRRGIKYSVVPYPDR